MGFSYTDPFSSFSSVWNQFHINILKMWIVLTLFPSTCHYKSTPFPPHFTLNLPHSHIRAFSSLSDRYGQNILGECSENLLFCTSHMHENEGTGDWRVCTKIPSLPRLGFPSDVPLLICCIFQSLISCCKYIFKFYQRWILCHLQTLNNMCKNKMPITTHV